MQYPLKIQGFVISVTICSKRFLEILALTYGRGPFIIWKSFPSQLCFRTIFEMHTAPGACLLYAAGAVCFSNMVLEHMQLRIFFKIYKWSLDHRVLMLQAGMVLDNKSRLISRGQNLKRAWISHNFLTAGVGGGRL